MVSTDILKETHPGTHKMNEALSTRGIAPKNKPETAAVLCKGAF